MPSSFGTRVDSGCDGSGAARCSAVPQFAFHSEQHGCVRIVAHQCGWLGCRVGEASNPGPVSRRRRMRALPPNQMMRVGTSFADWSHMLILTRNLFCHHPVHQRRSSGRSRRICAAPRATRRVVLVPRSQGGTPASIQDARETLPSTTLVDADVLSTFPASSGAVRRLVLVNNSPMAQGEMLPSPRRRPPSRRLVLAPGTGMPQSVQDRVPSPDTVASTPIVRSQDTRVEHEFVMHHMESNRESNAVVHPTEPDALTTVVDPSDLLLRANRFSPLSPEIDDEPLPPIEVPAFRRRLTLVGVTRQNQDGESDTDSLEIPCGRPGGEPGRICCASSPSCA